MPLSDRARRRRLIHARLYVLRECLVASCSMAASIHGIMCFAAFSLPSSLFALPSSLFPLPSPLHLQYPAVFFAESWQMQMKKEYLHTYCETLRVQSTPLSSPRASLYVCKNSQKRHVIASKQFVAARLISTVSLVHVPICLLDVLDVLRLAKSGAQLGSLDLDKRHVRFCYVHTYIPTYRG